jgi:hypothetical protein
MIRCDHAGKYSYCADCGHSEEHLEFNDCARKPVACAAVSRDLGEDVVVVCVPVEDKG